PRGHRPHGGDRRRRGRRVGGGRRHLARTRGQDHARRGRRHAAHDAPEAARRMRLRGLPSTPATPPETPGEAPGTPPAWRRLGRVPRLRDLRDGLRRNRGLKAISLVLAFFLWYSINVTERDAERTVDLPVTVRKLPQGLIVTNPPAKPVAVTLRGPR